mgnify:CR=1 FL=1
MKATDLLENFVKDVEWENIKVLGNLSGAEFERYEAKHPLYDKKSLIISLHSS